MIDYDKDGRTFIDLMDETQINTGLISESKRPASHISNFHKSPKQVY